MSKRKQDPVLAVASAVLENSVSHPEDRNRVFELSESILHMIETHCDFQNMTNACKLVLAVGYSLCSMAEMSERWTDAFIDFDGERNRGNA